MMQEDLDVLISSLLKRVEKEIVPQVQLNSRAKSSECVSKKTKSGKGKPPKVPGSNLSTSPRKSASRTGSSDGTTWRQRRVNSSFSHSGSLSKNRNSPRLNRSTPPNFTSFDDFPPIGEQSDTAKSQEHLPQSRSTGRGLNSGQRKSRRITPTPLGHEGASNSFSTPAGAWTVHPAFVDTEQSFSCEDTRFQRQQGITTKEATHQELPSHPSAQQKESSAILGGDPCCSKGNTREAKKVTPLSLDDVTHKEQLCKLAAKYTEHIRGGRVVNVGSALHQLVRLLTLPDNLEIWKQIQIEDKEKEVLSFPLDSLANCSYFVAKVLEENKDFLMLFVKETLHLLSINPRLSEMSPSLKVWLEETCAAKSAEYDEAPLSDSSSVFGVTFNTERNGKDSFPNDKAFHAFKKQRDAFYDLYQQWRSTTDLDRDELVAKKARSVLMVDGICSQGALAQLFLLQLLKSCKSREPSQGFDDSISERLKQADPKKLKKLTERFTGPLQRSLWQSKGLFVGEEDFFHKFILYSDSYNFSEHLKHVLVAEVHKLNNPSILYGSPKDYKTTVDNLQVLVKFLGSVVYQPYKDSTASSKSDWGGGRDRGVSQVLLHPIDVRYTLQSALRGHHILLTLPWVVDYLMMMNLAQEELKGEKLMDVLSILFELLRISLCGLKMEDNGRFLITLTIGHLVESQGFAKLYQDHLEKEGDPLIKEWAETVTMSKDYLDSLNIVTAEVLHSFSPVFDEVHTLLAQFAVGHKVAPSPIRKIKPVPVFTSQFSMEKPKTKEEEQIEEAFMGLQPAFVKQLCDVVATRLAVNMEQTGKDHIIPSVVQSGTQQMAILVRKKLKERCTPSEQGPVPSLDFLTQSEVSGALALVISRCVREVHSEITQQSSLYFQKSTSEVFAVLLKPALTETASRVTEKICVSLAQRHLMKWMHSFLAVKVQDQLQKNFDKLKRSVVSGIEGNKHFQFSPLTQQLLSMHNQAETRPLIAPTVCTSSFTQQQNVSSTLQEERQLPSTSQPAGSTSVCEEGNVSEDYSHRPTSSTPKQENLTGSTERPTSSTPKQETFTSSTERPRSSTPKQEYFTGSTEQPISPTPKHETFTGSTERPTSSTPKQEDVFLDVIHQSKKCTPIQGEVPPGSTHSSFTVPAAVQNSSHSVLNISSLVDVSFSSHSVHHYQEKNGHLVQPLLDSLDELQSVNTSETTKNDALGRLLDHTLCTLSAVYTDTTIEGVVVPVLMTIEHGHTLADVTIKISLELISSGHSMAVTSKIGSLFFDIWRLLRACKVDIPWQPLLQSEHCFRLDSSTVFVELGCCLGNLVEHNIASSREVEALWLATLKFKESLGSNVTNHMKAAVVFLNSYFQPVSESEDPVQGEQSSISGGGCRDCPLHIHFIRLLCYVHTRTEGISVDLKPHPRTIAVRMLNSVY